MLLACRHIADGFCPDLSFPARTLLVSSPQRGIYKVGGSSGEVHKSYLANHLQNSDEYNKFVI